MGKIEIDLEKARREADELETIGKKLKKIATRNIETTICDISRNWQSDNSEEFCRKGRYIKSDIETLSNQLIETATTVRTIAKRTYEAEKKMQEIATKRTYI